MRRGGLKAAEIIGVAEDELHFGRRPSADGARRRRGSEAIYLVSTLDAPVPGEVPPNTPRFSALYDPGCVET